ncbi:hypothetical protein Lalb_Chr14g0372741 [Lupinus albus]|uniref:Epidermal patterning factor-like protein n=1 Tax=Lupinus albus TaxID=3870 RepID=A0A6A4PG30_LUPAL|nr:hypothetical protein Lalb_Chr14g0372741 [Lupinus albus]
MKGRFFCCFLLALQIVSLVSEATRHFPPPPDAMSHPGQLLLYQFHIHSLSDDIYLSSGPEEAPATHSSLSYTKELQKVTEAMSVREKESYDRGVNRIGSSPPSCEHKCYGCTPCDAIQVPSNNNMHIKLSLQYTNYEPESWKCKCGVTLYSP